MEQHHSQAAYTAAGHESDLDSAPHFFSPSELTLSASRSNMFAFTAGAADRVSLANHLFFSVDSREEMSTAQSSVDRPRVTLVNFAPQDSQALPGGDEKGECLDGEDADWCENSMAVELSSVDSFAVRDMRQCEIASVADKVRLATSIAPSLDQMSTEGEEVSSPRPPLGPTSLGRSTYLEKEGSNDESDGADSENTEDAPSDASVATSLCVEINSLDEDGSYIGYGGACYDEEDFEMQGHDYIRGQPSSLPLRTRSNDSDESYATCYARWKSLCGRNGAPADPSYSTLRHQIGTVDRGSDSSARRGKRKRDDSSISRHSNKRGVLCSSRSPTVDGSIDTSVGYVARTSSPGSLSVDKNGNEDGYDGASECGGRSDMVDAGYMTSDNEAAGRDGHENGYGDEGLMSPPHRLPKTRCDPLEPAVHKVPSSGWSVQAQCHPRKARVANRRRKGES